MARILRPLNYGDLFDEMFDLYKKNFLLFVGAVALVSVPAALLNYIVALKTTLPAMQQLMNHPPSSSADPYAVLTPFLGMLKGSLVLVVTFWPLQMLMQGALTIAVSSSYLGEKPTILGSYKATLPRLLPLMGASLLSSLMCMFAAIFCCLPVIPVAMFLSFVSEVVILERFGSLGAVKRSFSLVAFDKWKVFVVGLLSILLLILVSLIASLPFDIIQGVAHLDPFSGTLYTLRTFVTTLSNILITPLYIIAFLLLYYDIRVRREGFDLQLLAQNMGQTSETSPVETELK